MQTLIPSKPLDLLEFNYLTMYNISCTFIGLKINDFSEGVLRYCVICPFIVLICSARLGPMLVKLLLKVLHTSVGLVYGISL